MKRYHVIVTDDAKDDLKDTGIIFSRSLRISRLPVL